MAKKLSDMTLEELWQLFPIILTKHQDCWADWYQEEQRILSDILPKEVVINHIGSTAINGIWAKPIIDILIEIPKKADIADIKKLLVCKGYICMADSAKRVSLNKGYTENGFAERVFHLHVRYAGDNDEILFRDYLNEHAELAKEYEKLKLGLWKEFEHDRDGYTNAKSAFVRKCMEAAKAEL